jgi:hypothetical protein
MAIFILEMILKLLVYGKKFTSSKRSLYDLGAIFAAFLATCIADQRFLLIARTGLLGRLITLNSANSQNIGCFVAVWRELLTFVMSLIVITYGYASIGLARYASKVFHQQFSRLTAIYFTGSAGCPTSSPTAITTGSMGRTPAIIYRTCRIWTKLRR